MSRTIKGPAWGHHYSLKKEYRMTRKGKITDKYQDNLGFCGDAFGGRGGEAKKKMRRYVRRKKQREFMREQSIAALLYGDFLSFEDPPQNAEKEKNEQTHIPSIGFQPVYPGRYWVD